MIWRPQDDVQANRDLNHETDRDATPSGQYLLYPKENIEARVGDECTNTAAESDGVAAHPSSMSEFYDPSMYEFFVLVWR